MSRWMVVAWGGSGPRPVGGICAEHGDRAAGYRQQRHCLVAHRRAQRQRHDWHEVQLTEARVLPADPNGTSSSAVTQNGATSTNATICADCWQYCSKT